MVSDKDKKGEEFIVSHMVHQQEELRVRIMEIVEGMQLIESKIGEQPELEEAKRLLASLAERLGLGNLYVDSE